MTRDAVSGACPRNFQPVHGDVMLPPTKDCDLKIKLQAGDDFFLTSNVSGGGGCGCGGIG